MPRMRQPPSLPVHAVYLGQPGVDVSHGNRRCQGQARWTLGRSFNLFTAYARYEEMARGDEKKREKLVKANKTKKPGVVHCPTSTPGRFPPHSTCLDTGEALLRFRHHDYGQPVRCRGGFCGEGQRGVIGIALARRPGGVWLAFAYSGPSLISGLLAVALDDAWRALELSVQMRAYRGALHAYVHAFIA
ncbi:hypothetical protein MRX96_046042 [Rhipicephalus microplus]